MDALISEKALQSALKRHEGVSFSEVQIQKAIEIASEIQQRIHADTSELSYKEKIKLAQRQVLANYATDNVSNSVLEFAKSMAASERAFAAAKTKRLPKLASWERQLPGRIQELLGTERTDLAPIV